MAEAMGFQEFPPECTCHAQTKRYAKVRPSLAVPSPTLVETEHTPQHASSSLSGAPSLEAGMARSFITVARLLVDTVITDVGTSRMEYSDTRSVKHSIV